MSRISSAEIGQTTLAGGGGTDMRVGIERALQGADRPNVIIVLTDGYTPWPAEPVTCRVIAALVGGTAGSLEYPNPPGWVEIVHIGPIAA